MLERVSVIHDHSLVAFVDVDSGLSIIEKAERAFELTNSIVGDWWDNPEVTPMAGTQIRSTSVGDQVLVGTTKLMCKYSGWENLAK